MIAVVGGGLVGACVAFELSQSGREVVVLDADLPGAAWRAGAGLLSPAGERLNGTLLEADARESLALWPGFARRLEEHSGQSVGFRPGLFRVAFSPEEANELHLTQEGEAAFAPLPHLEAARFHPDEGRVHPSSVRCAALHGLNVVRARVERLEPSATGVTLHTSEGTLEAEAAIVCCGAWSGAFGLPVGAEQGQALLLDASPDAPTLYGPPQVGSSSYALGRPDGLYVGATSRVTNTGEVAPDPEALDALCAKARQLLGAEQAQASVLQHLVGFRPTTPDGLPIVAPHPQLKNVLVATGHSRHGVLLAPLTAQRVARLVRQLFP